MLTTEQRATGHGFRRVTVVGAGLMGRGIAAVLAAGGLDVRICDLRAEAARDAAEFAGEAAARAGHLGQVTGTAALPDAVSGADLVVEAVVEDIAVKRGVFAAVSAAAPDAVLATNTSVLPVTEIATGALCPERVLGAHWWNPPDLIPVVEVIPGRLTAADLPGRMMTLLASLGKTPVLVRRDVPGFIGNRLQHALWREAIAMVAEGICDAETVDMVARNTIGLRLARMGPLENADYVGLDLTLAIHEAVLPSLSADSEPSPLLAALVRRGDLGARTGQGFLPWGPGGRPRAAQGLAAHLVAQVPSGASRCGDAPAGEPTGAGRPAAPAGPAY